MRILAFMLKKKRAEPSPDTTTILGEKGYKHNFPTITNEAQWIPLLDFFLDCFFTRRKLYCWVVGPTLIPPSIWAAQCSFQTWTCLPWCFNNSEVVKNKIIRIAVSYILILLAFRLIYSILSKGSWKKSKSKPILLVRNTKSKGILNTQITNNAPHHIFSNFTIF